MHTILPQLQATKKASSQIAQMSSEARTLLVKTIAQAIDRHADIILRANQIDAEKLSDEDPKKDRLIINEKRLAAITDDMRTVADLPDPTGKVLLERTLENELALQKIAVPLGVVGMIYESRPNVTLDMAALCLKSGNAAVLRGGSDAEKTNQAMVKIIRETLTQQNLSADLVQLLPVDRKYVKELLAAEKYIDILIPRGSQNLIRFVRENSNIPTIETGAGVCHTYIEKTADMDMAQKIVENAKLQRPSVCNALDTILVDETAAVNFLPRLVSAFTDHKVDIYADKAAFDILKAAGYALLYVAGEDDFGREFLGYGCSIKIVRDINEALNHIAQYSSKHSEAIVSEDKALCEQFIREVDAAAVYSNASTRFTDGGVFGLGAEIGISTQKLHARGPFALEKLVTEKWIVRGNGQVRT